MKRILIYVCVCLSTTAHASVISQPIEVGDFIVINTCKEHDCARNSQDIVVNRKTMHTVSLIQEDCHVRILGNPTADEQKILNTFNSLQNRQYACPGQKP